MPYGVVSAMRAQYEYIARAVICCHDENGFTHDGVYLRYRLSGKEPGSVYGMICGVD